ncbi:MAG TPA: hypothetical protein PL063_07990 [Candidatus Cloacimonadota bacterium]|nr:hypothetical protein [Candidatus Cloacimonadota bacterium]HQB41673.1 hypothetical protein [Candidatus Cloacimonadota bacterium]
MKKGIMILFLLLMTMTIFAEIIPVEIVNNADDSNGLILVSKFRDLIRKSPAYTISYNKAEPHFKIVIDTMDRFKDDKDWEGSSIIYNYTILISMGEMDFYGYNQLGFVGKNHLDSIANVIYSELDEFIETFLSLIADAY